MPKTNSGRFERGGKRYEQEVPVSIVFVGSNSELLYWSETIQSLRDFYLEKKDIEVLVEAAWCENPVQAMGYINAGRVDIIVSRIYFSGTCHRRRPAGILGMITDAVASKKQDKPPRILLYDQLTESISEALEAHFGPIQQDGVFISLYNSREPQETKRLVRDLTGAVAMALDPLFHYAGEIRA